MIELSEKEIQTSILHLLKSLRIFHFRNNSGATVSQYKGKKRLIRFGAVGSPDIILVIRGIFIGFEIKNSKNKQSEYQKNFQIELERAGGKYFIIRSLKEAEEVLKSLLGSSIE